MTHLQILEPTIDSLQGKHFQHTVVIRNSTSLQTSPSRQALEMTCPPRHTTSWIHLDRKTKSHLTRLHHPRYCAQSVQHTILCRLRQIEPCGPFQSSCFLKKVLVIPSATQLCYDSCVHRVFSCSSKHHLSLFLCEDVHFGEGSILEFPTRRKSDRSLLVASVPL